MICKTDLGSFYQDTRISIYHLYQYKRIKVNLFVCLFGLFVPIKIFSLKGRGHRLQMLTYTRQV